VTGSEPVVDIRRPPPTWTISRVFPAHAQSAIPRSTMFLHAHFLHWFICAQDETCGWRSSPMESRTQ
jgi:hypothetical protein